MTTLFRACLLATGFGILAVPAAARADDGDAPVTPSNFRLSTGVSYSSGDYGEIEDTEVLAVPVSLTFTKSGLKVRVSVPFVHVDGPGSLISTPEGRDGGSGQGRGRGRGGDSDNSGSGSGSGDNEIEVEDEDEDEVLDDDDDDIFDNDGFDDDDDIFDDDDDDGIPDDIDDMPADTGDNTLAADNTRRGIGDVKVTAVYSFDLGDRLYFEPGVKLKLPTASRRKRLGTGKFDVTLTADLVKGLGNATFYIHGRRKFAGKPTGSTIRSTWGAGGGASVRVARSVAIGADYDWQQSAFEGRQASSEATAWAYTRLNRQLGLTIYASTGFNDNSADISGGASISYRF